MSRVESHSSWHRVSLAGSLEPDHGIFSLLIPSGRSRLVSKAAIATIRTNPTRQSGTGTPPIGPPNGRRKVLCVYMCS